MQDTDFREHLAKRGWHPCLNSWVDYEKQLVTFPLLTLHKSMIGYQRYDWRTEKKRDNGDKGRYFTWVADAYKQCYVYGMDNVFGYGPLFVTEGIWDAIRVTLNWFDCVATLTATPTSQTKQWLRMIANGRPLVAISDEDMLLGKSWADLQVTPPAHDMSDMEHDSAGQWLTNVAKSLN